MSFSNSTNERRSSISALQNAAQDRLFPNRKNRQNKEAGQAPPTVKSRSAVLKHISLKNISLFVSITILTSLTINLAQDLIASLGYKFNPFLWFLYGGHVLNILMEIVINIYLSSVLLIPHDGDNVFLYLLIMTSLVVPLPYMALETGDSTDNHYETTISLTVADALCLICNSVLILTMHLNLHTGIEKRLCAHYAYVAGDGGLACILLNVERLCELAKELNKHMDCDDIIYPAIRTNMQKFEKLSKFCKWTKAELNYYGVSSRVEGQYLFAGNFLRSIRSVLKSINPRAEPLGCRPEQDITTRTIDQFRNNDEKIYVKENSNIDEESRMYPYHYTRDVVALNEREEEEEVVNKYRAITMISQYNSLYSQIMSDINKFHIRYSEIARRARIGLDPIVVQANEVPYSVRSTLQLKGTLNLWITAALMVYTTIYVYSHAHGIAFVGLVIVNSFVINVSSGWLINQHDMTVKRIEETHPELFLSRRRAGKLMVPFTGSQHYYYVILILTILSFLFKVPLLDFSSFVE